MLCTVVTCHFSVHFRLPFFSPFWNTVEITKWFSISKFTLLKGCIDPPREGKSRLNKSTQKRENSIQIQPSALLGDMQTVILTFLTCLWGHLTFSSFRSCHHSKNTFFFFFAFIKLSRPHSHTEVNDSLAYPTERRVGPFLSCGSGAADAEPLMASAHFVSEAERW